MEKTLKNLIANNMDVYHLSSKDKIIPLLEKLVKKGETVAVGGSVTLNESGVIDFLRNGDYNFLDRFDKSLSRDGIEDIFRKSFFADTYITSSNAVTQNGELYNVDGNGNRVAALTFGPKSVIVIVGKNKLVKNLNEAVQRVKTIAAPKNCVRLGCDTYCSKTGGCVNPEGAMGSGCRENRICSSFVVTAYQQKPHRIKVIIVDESLGY